MEPIFHTFPELIQSALSIFKPISHLTATNPTGARKQNKLNTQHNFSIKLHGFSHAQLHRARTIAFATFDKVTYINVQTFNYHLSCYTGWPRKNATTLIH